MSIWHREIVKVHGTLKVYVEIQNEWSGAVRGSLREIHQDNNQYFCTADGKKLNVTADVNNFLEKEDFTKRAVKYYEKEGGF